MRSIASHKNSPCLQFVADQAPAEPVFLAHHLVFKISPHPQDRSDGPITVNRFKVGFMVAQVVVYKPNFFAINGVDVATATRIDGEHGPCWRGFHFRNQARRTDASTLNTLHHFVAHQFRANAFANHRASAITPNQVRGLNGEGLPICLF